MQNKVVIFDVDHTLFDTDRYLEQIFINLKEVLPDMDDEEIVAAGKEAYIKLREINVFHPKRFAEILQKHINKIIDTDKVIRIIEDPTLLASCIYSDVYETLLALQKDNIQLAVFSTGDRDLQLGKIRAVNSFFQEKDIHIYELKDIEIPQLLEQYEEKDIYVIDDHVRVLAQFAKQHIASVRILIVRPSVGYHSEDNDNFIPEYRINELSEVLAIVR